MMRPPRSLSQNKSETDKKRVSIETDDEVCYSTYQTVKRKNTSTAEADDPVAGLGFENRMHKAFFYNNDPKRPKIFTNIAYNGIDLKFSRKRNTEGQLYNTECKKPYSRI